MRNKITLLITLLSIILLLIATIQGINIGNFEVLSISQIKEKDNMLNGKIEEASTLTTLNYPNNVQELTDTFDNYKTQKQKYEELVDITNKKDANFYETKQYDITYMWRVLGKYAQNRNLKLGMDVQKNSDDLYDINFSVSGKYVNISQFIRDIEDDSDLFFRIYNFSMSGSGDSITSTFTVKNININQSTIK